MSFSLFYKQSKKLFYDFKIKKKGNGFNINIKNTKRTDLIINNLNNLDEINGKLVRILPWHDKDNPIIMFEYNLEKKYDILKLKKKLIKFDNNKRWLIYDDKINFIEKKMRLRNWDTYMEYKILKKYVNKYKKFNIFEIYTYICYKLKNYGCDENKIIRIPIPIKVPVEIPVPIKVPVEISVPIKTSQSIFEKKDNYINLLDTITEKIKITNEILNISKNFIYIC